MLAGTSFGAQRRGLPAAVLRQLAGEPRGGARGHGRAAARRSVVEGRRLAPHPGAGPRAPAGGARHVGLAARPPADGRGAARGRGRGADGLVTLLHDRVDDGAAGRPPARACGSWRTSRWATTTSTSRRAGARGVVATNTPGVLVDATADLAIALLLMVTRRLAEGERLLRRGEPWAWALDFMLGSGPAGADARHRRARGDRPGDRAPRPGLRHAHRLHGRRRADAGGRGGARSARQLELDELVSPPATSISLHCPLDAATRHLVDERRLRLMRPRRVARQHRAAARWWTRRPSRGRCGSGWIAGAALDVFEREPELHPGLVPLERRGARTAPRVGHRGDPDGHGAARRDQLPRRPGGPTCRRTRSVEWPPTVGPLR